MADNDGLIPDAVPDHPLLKGCKEIGRGESTIVLEAPTVVSLSAAGIAPVLRRVLVARVCGRVGHRGDRLQQQRPERGRAKRAATGISAKRGRATDFPE